MDVAPPPTSSPTVCWASCTCYAVTVSYTVVFSYHTCVYLMLVVLYMYMCVCSLMLVGGGSIGLHSTSLPSVSVGWLACKSHIFAGISLPFRGNGISADSVPTYTMYMYIHLHTCTSYIHHVHMCIHLHTCIYVHVYTQLRVHIDSPSQPLHGATNTYMYMVFTIEWVIKKPLGLQTHVLYMMFDWLKT